MWTCGCLLYMQTTISCKENGIEDSLAVESIECNQRQNFIPPACFLLLFFSFSLIRNKILTEKSTNFKFIQLSPNSINVWSLQKPTISLNCWWSLKWLAKIGMALEDLNPIWRICIGVPKFDNYILNYLEIKLDFFDDLPWSRLNSFVWHN